MASNLPFPIQVPFSSELFRSDFTYASETQFDDTKFHFGLPLPKNFIRVGEAGQTPVEPGNISLLAHYASTEGPRVEVGVSAWVLRREVNPADLVEILIGEAHEDILAKKVTKVRCRHQG